MTDLFLDIPTEQYKSLSESERYVLQYIVKNIQTIPELSIVKLSEQANVSTATIVRLMKKIGHDGYTSFKYSIRDRIQSKQHVETIDEVDKKIRQAIRKKRARSVKYDSND